MAEMLETIMLICFGLSWPISLVKTIRDQGRAGNIPFMCLILAGYAAGIIAKLITTGCNFVFYVYILNVFMVLANLIITLCNRSKRYGKGAASHSTRNGSPVGLTVIK